MNMKTIGIIISAKLRKLKENRLLSKIYFYLFFIENICSVLNKGNFSLTVFLLIFFLLTMIIPNFFSTKANNLKGYISIDFLGF